MLQGHNIKQIVSGYQLEQLKVNLSFKNINPRDSGELNLLKITFNRLISPRLTQIPSPFVPATKEPSISNEARPELN
jgi:hypothetical protein